MGTAGVVVGHENDRSRCQKIVPSCGDGGGNAYLSRYAKLLRKNQGSTKSDYLRIGGAVTNADGEHLVKDALIMNTASAYHNKRSNHSLW